MKFITFLVLVVLTIFVPPLIILWGALGALWLVWVCIGLALDKPNIQPKQKSFDEKYGIEEHYGHPF